MEIGKTYKAKHNDIWIFVVEYNKLTGAGRFLISNNGTDFNSSPIICTTNLDDWVLVTKNNLKNIKGYGYAKGG